MTIRDYLFKKTAQWIVFGLLVFALLLVWQLAIIAEKDILKNSATVLDDESLSVSKMKNQLAQTKAVIDRHRGNLKQIKDFREKFLTRKKDRIVGISNFFAEKAREHQLQLDQVQYHSTQSNDRALEIYNMDLPLVGRYRDIRAFIEDIEASDMFLIITQLVLEDNTDRQGAVQVQLSLATYFEGA